MRRLAVAMGLAAVLLVLSPDVVLACPVCFDPRAENRAAFLATTAFLSLFPLGMVGGLGLWLRRRAGELDDEAGDAPVDRDAAEG